MIPVKKRLRGVVELAASATSQPVACQEQQEVSSPLCPFEDVDERRKVPVGLEDVEVRGQGRVDRERRLPHWTDALGGDAVPARQDARDLRPRALVDGVGVELLHVAPDGRGRDLQVTCELALLHGRLPRSHQREEMFGDRSSSSHGNQCCPAGNGSQAA